MAERPPLPPFTMDTAVQKVRMAENAWNSRDPEKVSLAYTEDSFWRNRCEYLHGREAIVTFLKRKWSANSTIAWSRNFGVSAKIAWQSGSNTNGMTIAATGSARMATNCGNLMNVG